MITSRPLNDNILNEPSMLSIVGLESFQELSLDRLQGSIRDYVIDKNIQATVSAISGKLAAYLITIDERRYTLMYAPLENSRDAFSSAIESSLAWKDAGRAVAETLGQYIVASNRQEPDEQGSMSAAADITIISSAVAMQTRSTFVYWQPAGILTSTAGFIRQTETLVNTGQLPMLCWIAFKPRKSLDGPSAIYTKGLHPFLKKELAVIRKADITTILGNTIQLADFLLHQNRGVADGDILDLEDGDQLYAVISDALITATDAALVA